VGRAVTVQQDKEICRAQPKWKLILSALLVPYFGLIIMSQTPRELELRKLLYDPLNIYYTFFGVNQFWGMFAPNPPRSNWYGTCLITMADGTKVFFNVKQLENQDRFLMVKWNKLITENSFSDRFHEFLPDLARWVRGQIELPDDKPLMFSYNQWAGDIPPPSEPPVPRDKIPAPTKFTTWFVYAY
jgi:hypothetical protein